MSEKELLFSKAKSDFQQLIREEAYSVAAVKVLIDVVRNSKAGTFMELQEQLEGATAELKKIAPEIYIKAGCEIFMVSITRYAREDDVRDGDRGDHFGRMKSKMVQIGEKLQKTRSEFRKTISSNALRLFRPGMTVLTHSFSRVVMECLREAEPFYHLNVIVTEARLSGEDLTGCETAMRLAECGIPVSLIPDAGIAAVMHRVDAVLVGAVAVLESGGIVNRLGTTQMAMVAKEFKKPFYVAAESHKLTRLFPLTQEDFLAQTTISLPPSDEDLAAGSSGSLPGEAGAPQAPCGMHPLIKVDAAPELELTPPAYISLFITDVGVLTPSAIPDAFIPMYA